jgi:disulfide bond formation protein DsbB
MLQNFGAKICSKPWWLALIVYATALLGAALYYQHALDEWPCVLCIHVRILLALLLLVAVPAFFFHPQGKSCLLPHALITVLMSAMLERSWQLFGTEHGLIEGNCSVSLGLPEWLAIDQWLPNIFGVWSSCGYTPELAFGISMAEMLLVLSAAWLLLCIFILMHLLRNYFLNR